MTEFLEMCVAGTNIAPSVPAANIVGLFGIQPGQAITFETNVGDHVTAGPETPLRVVRDPETGEPSPYVMVRAGLEARIDRKTWYRLVEYGEEQPLDGAAWFGLWSGGTFFPVIPAAELR